MPVIRITIEPEFLGPVSVGTITPIKVLRDQLGLPLAVAKRFIDRAVFEGEEVEIPVDTLAKATAVADALRNTPGPATVRVEVDSD